MPIPLFGVGVEPTAPESRQSSELRQWPVQLHLVPVQAPFFDGADLALIADCVRFASPNTHADFIKDHAIAVGCPKLDDGRAYIAKLAQILSNNDVRSVTVVRMEVPCCGGLEFIAAQALAQSGKDIPLESVIVNVQKLISAFAFTAASQGLVDRVHCSSSLAGQESFASSCAQSLAIDT